MEKANVKLGRQDWIDGALEILMAKGIEAVKVDVIAKSLKITRGSFYWHFQNLDALLVALIERWQASSIDIAAKIEATGGEPSERLLDLFNVAANNKDDRWEKAMRLWATRDARANTAIERVDRQRLDYLEYLFLQLGFSKTEAEIRARVAYSVRLGWFEIAMPIDLAQRHQDIKVVYHLLTRSS